MKVTVLMSVYNGARFLHDSIRSIINQTFRDFEFIIIDDGSTDRSSGIIKSFNDSRIKFISNSENIGLTKSLNIGLSVAKGTYIARVDADDISLSDRLELQYKYFERHSGVTLLGGGAHFIDESNEVIRTKFRLPDHSSIFFYCFFNSPFIHSSVMFRKECLKTLGGYNSSFKCAQDYDLWSRWVACFKVANLEKVIVKWRNTSTGITNTRRAEQARYGDRISVNFFRRHIQGIEHIEDKVLIAIKNLKYNSFSGDNAANVAFVVDKMVRTFSHIKSARTFGLNYIAALNGSDCFKHEVRSIKKSVSCYKSMVSYIEPNDYVSEQTLPFRKEYKMWEQGVYKELKAISFSKNVLQKTLSVVICTVCNLDLLQRVCKAVLESPLVSQLIIVGNGVSNNTLEYLKTIKDDRLLVIYNKTNLGVIKARNQGIAQAKSYYTMVLDDDQLPSVSTFPQYIKFLVVFDIVGCDLQIMNTITGLTQSGNEDAFSYVGAGGMCMRTSLWKELGLFDEIFSPAYFEDPDIIERAKAKRLTIGYVKNHKITHREHQTLSRSDLGFNLDKVMLRNRKIFCSRYKNKTATSFIKNNKVKVLYVIKEDNINDLFDNVNLFNRYDESLLNIHVHLEVTDNIDFVEKVVVKFPNLKITSSKSYKVEAVGGGKRDTLYRNVGTLVQSVCLDNGDIGIVKPGGSISSRECKDLHLIPSFRFLEHEQPKKMKDTSAVMLFDSVNEFKPHIIYYKQDMNLDFVNDIKGVKAFRHESNVASIIDTTCLKGYDIIVALEEHNNEC